MDNILNSIGEMSMEDIYSKNIKIPFYQRPYKWKLENVRYLCEDIKDGFFKNNKYLLGNIILHEENDELNIVDGQQRLTTIALILKSLGKDDIDFLENKININSKEALKRNYSFIKSYFSNFDRADDLIKFILNNLVVTYIKTKDLDEAFKFFDTQNSRGKKLDDVDLLKNHHFMHLGDMDISIQKQIAKEWKKYENMRVDSYHWSMRELLKCVINDLYILRLMFDDRNFTFGTWINRQNFVLDEFKTQIRGKNLNLQDFKFSSNIVGGMMFFDYTFKYAHIYEILKQKADFSTKWLSNQAMMMLLLVYVDKFGFDENFEKFYENVFVRLFVVLARYGRIDVNSIELVYITKGVFNKILSSDYSFYLIERLEYDLKFDFFKFYEINEYQENIDNLLKDKTYLKDKDFAIKNIERISFNNIKIK
ncbi:DUF262 domain-containing protein [Campylobacter ureolyticus]|uniref:DUF262 domain-containing protein n=1 Tax=Campylobacter ureolyticus TaxID=827 RepID=UPI0022B38169|nr:DUF262 domain-containing protein [Campylobacter ureolyticus]MCZ6186305.1 DUF262 domain-containing protein [Campylobacter ureolyticus]